MWKADGIGGAVSMGLHETHRVMMMTYLTFARLVQGTVKIEHLKGPVGIAHVGVKIADRGLVWLLFFLALISVNLAVINFLPIPIADGGHMVFLLYEQFTGKPPAASVQNAAAVIGLVLLGGVFLIVTFHDVGNLVSEVARWVGR
ncbi:MAG: site-2 protease family protein [Phycisphaerales bacterium]|nr:site-2 protease family protein [Phycisphaerales bacterium]